jgi:hypothetical protein
MRCVYIAYGKEVYLNHSMNINRFITISSMSYKTLQTTYPEGKQPVIMNFEDDKFARKSIYGGRCYPQKQLFKSSDVNDSLKSGMVASYDSIKDYLFDADVVSLYPYCLTKEYPSGPHKVIVNEFLLDTYLDLIRARKEIGTVKFYLIECNLTPNTSLFTSVLPSRNENGNLVYELFPIKRQVYTNIDIEMALDHGYTIDKIYKMITWSASYNWFKIYIDKCFALKAKAEKDSASYSVCKLMANAIYGYTLKKNIITKTKIITTIEELENIRIDHVIKDFIIMGNDRILCSYEVCDITELDKCVKTPAYLGAFCLAYSRQHMSSFLDICHSYYDKNFSFYRTDTDSLILHARCLPLLIKAKVIGKDLGMLDFDLNSQDNSTPSKSIAAKIIRFCEPFPKVYCCEYVNKYDTVVKKGKDKGKITCPKNIVNTHTRAKGFIRSAKKLMQYEDFENLLIKSKSDKIDEQLIDDAFNKIKKQRLIYDDYKNVIGSLDFVGGLCSYTAEKFRRNVFSQKLVDAGKHSTVEIIKATRCLGNNEWCKRTQLYDNEYTSLPKGYKFDIYCPSSNDELYDKPLLFSYPQKNILKQKFIQMKKNVFVQKDNKY